jgi:hypothetical protein
MSRRTAYNLLDVHEKFGGESVQILHTLPRSVLDLLAVPSTPDEVREEAIERVGAGERLTPAEVREKVEAARSARQLVRLTVLSAQTSTLDASAN